MRMHWMLDHSGACALILSTINLVAGTLARSRGQNADSMDYSRRQHENRETMTI